MKKERAVAACGWRVTELQALHVIFIAMAAQLFEDIEKGGEWPDIFKEVLTTSLKKEEDPKTEEVSAQTYLLPTVDKTRPINNLSPWVTAWQAARWESMTQWREEIMPEEMHGARARHE
eukprot:12423159-Karenia_brevis.AAC.1